MKGIKNEENFNNMRNCCSLFLTCFWKQVSIGMLSLLLFLISGEASPGQDLDDLLEEEMGEETIFTSATFKSTRVINGMSIERMQKKQLDFRISHRFGTVNSGIYEFFGLDQASLRLGFDYGINDWLMIGIGRSTYEKTVDGFIKFSALRQSKGAKVMPVSLSLVSFMAINTLKWEDPERENYFSNRLSYVFQAMVARKISERLSLQLTPTLVHKNLVKTRFDQNDLFALGISGRFKLTKRTSLNLEYFYTFRKDNPDPEAIQYYNSFSIGYDIETGGHVFQIIITNSQPMIEKGFITETTGKWLDGDIHLGFNISRAFSFK